MVATGTEARPTNFTLLGVLHRNMNHRLRTGLKNPDHDMVAAPGGPFKAVLTCLDSARLAVILKIRCLPTM